MLTNILWMDYGSGIKNSSEVLLRCKEPMDSTKEHNNHYIYLLTEKELLEERMINITEGRNKEKGIFFVQKHATNILNK